ncbi:MAG: 4Fe-4S binding protein [Deltaproteobacteria bacterium]|nr:4Fe-4S binding protein [Deltaproteobacteria bacterium]
MREMVVISGKGGTGKTSLVGAFSALARNKVLCDADVDAADLHLLLQPEIRRRESFQGGGLAVIDVNRCTGCGLCIELCQWNAISDDFVVDPIACEGCGVCVHFCPEDAVDFPRQTCGEWYVSETRFGPMVHAGLGIAEENSGKLVTLVRKEARNLAEARGLDLIITDGPPGIGCPVIASIGGASAVLVVTEPTVSGEHDLERVLQLVKHFRVPAMVLINKSDLNPDMAGVIERKIRELGAVFVGSIPFSKTFTQAVVQGKTVPELDPNDESARKVIEIWEEVHNRLASLPSR